MNGNGNDDEDDRKGEQEENKEQNPEDGQVASSIFSRVKPYNHIQHSIAEQDRIE